MAYDAGQAQILRDDLVDQTGVTEKKMFGGVCFLLNGNMLCGVGGSAPMFRVGKDNEAEALTIEGVSPLTFTGRKMGGLVEMGTEEFTDDALRQSVLKLALDFVVPLPAK